MSRTTPHVGECTDVQFKSKGLVIYQFRDDNGQVFEPSAFQPSKEGDLPLPPIFKGKKYAYTTEERIVGEKTYLNFGKKWAGKKPVGYDISPFAGAPSAPSPLPTPTPQPQPQPASAPAPYKSAADMRFERMEAERPVQQFHMRRGGLSHDAMDFVVGLLNRQELVAQGKNDYESVDARLKAIKAEVMALHKSITAQMVKDAEEAEVEFNNAGLKPQHAAKKGDELASKKTDIEGNP